MPTINYIGMALSLAGLIAVIRLIRAGLLRERYALIWLFSGILAVLACASPNAVWKVCKILEVTVPLNLLLFVAIVFLGGVCLMLSIVVSRQAIRIECLAKELAIVKHETGRS